MGTTKTDLFSIEQNELAQLAKVFAHPARIAIIQFLVRSQGCINSDLVEELGLAQPTVSQHLRELKDIGIIQGTIDGTRMNYCIDSKRWTEIQHLFERFFSSFQSPPYAHCC